MQSPVLAIIGMSVRLSVRLSRAGIVSKRGTLGSKNLHRRIDQTLCSQLIWFSQKFEKVHQEWGK